MKTLMITSFSFLTCLLIGSAAMANSESPDLKGIETNFPAIQTPPPYPGAYYDWGRGNDGWGYCYQWAPNGQVLNQGRPVANYNCESYRPSHFNWGQGQNGYGYCYQYTPYGIPMNQGQPQANYQCENYSPSFYRWGQGQDGYTRCYQWTQNGLVLNDGRPVPNYYCQY